MLQQSPLLCRKACVDGDWDLSSLSQGKAAPGWQQACRGSATWLHSFDTITPQPAPPLLKAATWSPGLAPWACCQPEAAPPWRHMKSLGMGTTDSGTNCTGVYWAALIACVYAPIKYVNMWKPTMHLSIFQHLNSKNLTLCPLISSSIYP